MDQHAHEQPWCRLHDPLSSAMLFPDEGRPYAVSNKSVGCTKCWVVRPSRKGPSLSISNTQGKDTHCINSGQLWVPISGRSCHICCPSSHRHQLRYKKLSRFRHKPASKTDSRAISVTLCFLSNPAVRLWEVARLNTRVPIALEAVKGKGARERQCLT